MREWVGLIEGLSAVDFENCLKIDWDSRRFSAEVAVPGSNHPHFQM